MSPELIGVIVGGAIGIIGSMATVIMNHYLTLHRDRLKQKLEAEKTLREQLSAKIPPEQYNRTVDRLYNMIDKGQFSRSHLITERDINEIVGELEND